MSDPSLPFTVSECGIGVSKTKFSSSTDTTMSDVSISVPVGRTASPDEVDALFAKTYTQKQYPPCSTDWREDGKIRSLTGADAMNRRGTRRSTKLTKKGYIFLSPSLVIDQATDMSTAQKAAEKCFPRGSSVVIDDFEYNLTLLTTDAPELEIEGLFFRLENKSDIKGDTRPVTIYDIRPASFKTYFHQQVVSSINQRPYLYIPVDSDVTSVNLDLSK